MPEHREERERQEQLERQQRKRPKWNGSERNSNRRKPSWLNLTRIAQAHPAGPPGVGQSGLGPLTVKPATRLHDAQLIFTFRDRPLVHLN